MRAQGLEPTSRLLGMDYVREVSTKKIYRWDPEDKLSAPWSIAQPRDGEGTPALPPIRFRIAAYDYRFTTRAERAQTGAWWKRTLKGYLTEPVSAR